MRYIKRPSMDDLASPDVRVRSEILRELVDGLPDRERYVIERTFFGFEGATLDVVAAELKVSVKSAREYRNRGFERIRAALLEADGVGSLFSDGEPCPVGFDALLSARDVAKAERDARQELPPEGGSWPDRPDVGLDDLE